MPDACTIPDNSSFMLSFICAIESMRNKEDPFGLIKNTNSEVDHPKKGY
jgi:hypothetical protein